MISQKPQHTFSIAVIFTISPQFNTIQIFFSSDFQIVVLLRLERQVSGTLRIVFFELN